MANPPPPANAGQRRALFGLNTGVAVTVAVCLVILLNWLVFWQYAATPPAVKRFVRFDLSATRSHSFSPQTRHVLAALQTPHTLVAVFRDDAKQSELAAARRRHLEDLLEEYARTNRQITVRTISVARDSAGADGVAREVAQRFAKETLPLQTQLKDASAAMAAVAADLSQWQPALDALASAPYASEAHQARARGTANALARLRLKLLAAVTDAQKELAAPMPDCIRVSQAGYDTLLAAHEEIKLSRQVLSETLVGGASKLEDRETALNLAARMKGTPAQCLQAAYVLQNARSTTAYEQARMALASGETLVVLADKRARVVPVERLFRRVGDNLAKAGVTAQDSGAEQFTGEEQITGALVSLSLSPAPRVVFLQANAGAALTPDNPGQDSRPGLFQAMAERLRALDFEVVETNVWSDKNMTDAGWPINLPQALPGQKTVWVMCPFLEPNPRNPASLKMDSREKTCDFLQKQLDKGDSAMVLLNHDPLPDPARVAVADEVLGKASSYEKRHPVAALLKRQGMDAHLWEALAHEVQEPGMQPVPALATELRHYPADSAVSRAVEGLTLRLERPFPVLPLKPAPAGVTVHEVASVLLPRLYTLGYEALHNGAAQSYNPASALPYAPVALAAECPHDARVMAVGDLLWATDLKTTYGHHPEWAPASSGGAVGMANLPGGISAYPGNAELFVNGVCWLAHLDDLVAPGARSQDVRRIAPMGEGLSLSLRLLLLLGLPLGAAAAGIGVWVLRKRF